MGLALEQVTGTGGSAGLDAGVRVSRGLTSAGLTALYGAGVYTDRDIADFAATRNLPKYRRPGGEPLPRFRDMISYVKSHYDDVANSERINHYFFFYGNYYAAQAMFITGGRDWADYYTRLREDLLRMQRPDGGVPSNVGTAFSTAVTALLNILLVWWFLTQWGLLGAAYAMLLVEILGCLGRWTAFLMLVPTLNATKDA